MQHENTSIEFSLRQKEAAEAILGISGEQFVEALRVLRRHIQKGSTILAFGNGGSASNAAHFSSDLVQSMLKKGRKVASFCVNSDMELNTALANDNSFESVLAHRVLAQLNEGDLLVVFSVSGESLNIVEGLRTASQCGVETLGLLGGSTSTSSELLDHELSVRSSVPEIVETAHAFAAQELAKIA